MRQRFYNLEQLEQRRGAEWAEHDRRVQDGIRKATLERQGRADSSAGDAAAGDRPALDDIGALLEGAGERDAPARAGGEAPTSRRHTGEPSGFFGDGSERVGSGSSTSGPVRPARPAPDLDDLRAAQVIMREGAHTLRPQYARAVAACLVTPPVSQASDLLDGRALQRSASADAPSASGGAAAAAAPPAGAPPASANPARTLVPRAVAPIALAGAPQLPITGGAAAQEQRQQQVRAARMAAQRTRTVRLDNLQV